MRFISQEEWTVLFNNYCHGEKRGSEFIEQLIDFAPGEEERKWIRIWAAEEMHHHKLWDELLEKKKIPRQELTESIRNIYNIAGDFVTKKDWIGSMVSALIIEHLSNATAAYLYRYADLPTQMIFKKITGDDLGHLDFDYAQLERAAQTKEGRKRIKRANTVFLKEILQWPMRTGVTASDIDILNNTYEIHRMKLRKIGVKIPNIHFSRRFSFRVKKAIVERIR